MTDPKPTAPKPSSGCGNTGAADDEDPPNALYNWIFTWNNPTEDNILMLETYCANCAKKWAFQEEIGKKCKTRHLQGALSLKKKMRLKGLKSHISKKPHWEGMFKPWHVGAAYALKEDTHVGRRWQKGCNFIRPVRMTEPLRPWQCLLREQLLVADSRSILWYWEPTGNVGKSWFAKWMVVNEDATVVCGKAADMKHAIATQLDDGNEPRIIMVDVPRQSRQFLSMAGIEEIKNGLIFSGKYDSVTCAFACPSMVVFANTPPEGEMSLDRYKVFRINGDGMTATDTTSEWLKEQAEAAFPDDVVEVW